LPPAVKDESPCILICSGAQWAETPKTWPKSKKMMYVFQDLPWK
jgi:hypothetical protein